MTKTEFFDLCVKAGFSDASDGWFIYAESDDDKMVGIEEYAVGERLLALAKLLGIELKD